jgi:uncharacterized protein
MAHLCLHCGACCAAYRVPIYWSEAESLAIDPALTERLDSMRLAMRYDNSSGLRCVALAGTIGHLAHCTIYPQRPSPCRELSASFEDGTRNDQCERARIRHGLAALTPLDWLAPILADIADIDRVDTVASVLVESVAVAGIDPIQLA